MPKRLAPPWLVWLWCAVPSLSYAPISPHWTYAAACLSLVGAIALPLVASRRGAQHLVVNVVWGAASLCVFGAGAQGHVNAWTAAWASVALALGCLARPRAKREQALAAHGFVAVVLFVVAQTLWRTNYVPQALRTLALMQGLAAGAAFWQTRPRRLPTADVRLGAAAICIASLLGIVRAHLGQGYAAGAMLPAWRHAAGALKAPGVDVDEVQDLLWLEAVGAQDAAFVRIAQALEQNAAANTLRQMCPKRGWRGPLHQSFAPLVQRGRLICRALHSVMPEAGMAWLLMDANAEADAGLCRLVSDLAWEAGDVTQAQTWGLRATRLGDGFAADNTRFALDLRGHAQAQTGLAKDPSGAAIWARFNRAMHFDDFAVDSHHGLRLVDAPAHLGTLYDPNSRAQVLTMQSVYGLGAGLGLPVPQGAPMPAALRLHVRARGALRVVVRDSVGTRLTFDCDSTEASVAHADAGEAHRPLPPAACTRAWADVILPLRPGPRGTSLTNVTLYGEFMLASVEAIAARVAPCDQSADTGHDLAPDEAEDPCTP